MSGSIKTAAEMLAEMRSRKHDDQILFNAFAAQAIHGWSDEETVTTIAYHAMKCVRAASEDLADLKAMSSPESLK